ncbi:DNA-processing protein DprA [Luteimonas sp. MC1572]|uniref:DNA-processing protein DprA n=1 Tax=Luteimonas sp. MC1572 TaxID=2799325 RepID=UPI0018F0C655|nr:DNA-processing protein DprA [Luteimonas sp. MC1572]MBJ6981699.1 DNA-protecting protein DprA [Luteimonas sp. MC1572]QQO02989.1 DNA-protecting protein DprA [Luteimonas sp. MC1572]
MDPDSSTALLRLVAAGGASAPRRALLDAHGNPVAALAAGPDAWRDAGLDRAQRAVFAGSAGSRQVALAQAWLAMPMHHVVGWHDPDYPALLRRVASPPLALFVAGDPLLAWHPGVAVVGSRTATAGGLKNASDFARAMATSGLAVASGLAAGIDTAAHLGALAAPDGRTLAVLGTAIDDPYPRRNTGLYARIAASGAVISEHAPGTTPSKGAFPARNRILAGLSLGTLVVEAAWRSGALITARLAAESGREVFALPGSIHNPMARGCHRLIRDGAALVETPAEVVRALAPLATVLGDALRSRLASPMSGVGSADQASTGHDPPAGHEHHRLWQALGHDPTGMDELVLRTGLTAADLSSMLLFMELEGRVSVEHGRYSRKSCQ